MKRTTAADLQKEWMKNPKYRRGAGLTHDQVAKRMKTTQAAVARLEGGGSMPSTRTLDKYAKATGTRLKISFEPEGARP